MGNSAHRAYRRRMAKKHKEEPVEVKWKTLIVLIVTFIIAALILNAIQWLITG